MDDSFAAAYFPVAQSPVVVDSLAAVASVGAVGVAKFIIKHIISLNLVDEYKKFKLCTCGYCGIEGIGGILLPYCGCC